MKENLFTDRISKKIKHDKKLDIVFFHAFTHLIETLPSSSRLGVLRLIGCNATLQLDSNRKTDLKQIRQCPFFQGDVRFPFPSVLFVLFSPVESSRCHHRRMA